MTLNIYTDGGSRGNPGPGAIGVVIFDEKNKLINKFGKTIGKVTNNIAEYTAVKEALLSIKENNVILGSDSDSRIDSGQARMTKEITVHFFLDSLLVASQLAGIYKIKEPKLKELFGGIQLLIARLNINVSFSHIPREKNYLADLEVNKALDKEIYG